MRTLAPETIEALVQGRHGDPFADLGPMSCRRRRGAAWSCGCFSSGPRRSR